MSKEITLSTKNIEKMLGGIRDKLKEVDHKATKPHVLLFWFNDEQYEVVKSFNDKEDE